MTDDEWQKQRQRAVMVTFETGRPVFADSDGLLRFDDGAKELVPSGIGGLEARPPSSHSFTKAMRATRVAFAGSLLAAACNVVAGFWRPWHFAFAAVMLGSSFLWLHVYRGQRALYGARK